MCNKIPESNKFTINASDVYEHFEKDDRKWLKDQIKDTFDLEAGELKAQIIETIDLEKTKSILEKASKLFEETNNFSVLKNNPKIS